MAKADFYEILGVSRDADADTIKKAYRKLAMQFHPDRNPGNKEAEDKFKEAAEAYDVLSNQEKRAKYDRFGHNAFNGGMGGGGFHSSEDIFSSFGDIFSDFFGGGMGGSQSSQRNRNQPRRGSDLRYIAEITLEDVVKGYEKDIEFETDINCGDCNGSGAAKGSQPVTCGTCGGSGQVVRSQGFFTMATTCPTCAGAGTIIKDHCKSCKGKGRLRQKRKIKVTIPPGVDTGTRLRVSGEGEGGYRGGPSGDLFVEISVQEDDRFERDGEHLFSELSVDYLRMILGGEIEVPTVTGETVVQVPKSCQPGEKIRVPGEGVPSLRSGRRGDLFVTLQVALPKKLSKEEEKLLKELAEVRSGDAKNSDKSGFWSKKK